MKVGANVTSYSICTAASTAFILNAWPTPFEMAVTDSRAYILFMLRRNENKPAAWKRFSALNCLWPPALLFYTEWEEGCKTPNQTHITSSFFFLSVWRRKKEQKLLKKEKRSVVDWRLESVESLLSLSLFIYLFIYWRQRSDVRKTWTSIKVRM